MSQRRGKENRTARKSLRRRAVPVCAVLAAAVLAVGWSNGDFRRPQSPTEPPARNDTRQAETSPLPGLTGTMPAPVPEHPRLGISARTVTPAAAAYYSMKEESPLVPGVQIYELDDSGPAAKAGALPGDIIITLEEVPIDSEDQLDEAESLMAPGDTVFFIVYRQGEYVELEAEIPEE